MPEDSIQTYSSMRNPTLAFLQDWDSNPSADGTLPTLQSLLNALDAASLSHITTAVLAPGRNERA